MTLARIFFVQAVLGLPPSVPLPPYESAGLPSSADAATLDPDFRPDAPPPRHV